MTFNPSRKLDRDTLAMLQHIGVKDADLPPVKPRKARNTKQTASLTDAIISLIFLKGGWAMRCNCGLFRGFYGSSVVKGAPAGTPDIVGYLNGGKTVAIEVKVGRDAERPAQTQWLSEAKAKGVVCGVARNLDDAKKILEQA